MNNRFRIWFAVGVVFSLTFLVSLTAFAQGNEEPISFAKTLLVKIDGGAYTTGDNIPVSIPLAEIRKTAPDFNTDFFRVKHTFAVFEPRDIPSQILTLPGRKKKDSDLVFKVDLEKNTPLTVEIQYNPKGKDYPNYPAKTQSFASWYRLGINIAWENEIMAYRSYGGIVDFFAKTYPHLRLHNLPPDSYHHERFWGLDAYMVGAKPVSAVSFLSMEINGFPVTIQLKTARSNSSISTPRAARLQLSPKRLFLTARGIS